MPRHRYAYNIRTNNADEASWLKSSDADLAKLLASFKKHNEKVDAEVAALDPEFEVLENAYEKAKKKLNAEEKKIAERGYMPTRRLEQFLSRLQVYAHASTLQVGDKMILVSDGYGHHIYIDGVTDIIPHIQYNTVEVQLKAVVSENLVECVKVDGRKKYHMCLNNPPCVTITQIK